MSEDRRPPPSQNGVAPVPSRPHARDLDTARAEAAQRRGEQYGDTRNATQQQQQSDQPATLRIPQPANDPRFPPQARQQGPAEPRQSATGSNGRRPEATPRRSKVWRWVRRTAICLGVLLGIALVGIAALQIRLTKGPISIPYLVGPIEDGLSRELTGNRVRIDDLVLYRSERSGRIEFRLQNLRLIDESGATIGRAPQAAIDLSRNAMLRGAIAPKSIELIRPRLVLSYDDTAGISLRVAGFQKKTTPTPDNAGDTDSGLEASASAATTGLKTPDIGLVDVLKDAFRTARERSASTSFLKRIGIRDAVVVLRSATQQTVWSAPRLGLEMRHQSSRSIIRGQGTMSDGQTPWSFAFEIDDTPARGAFQVRTIFRDLVPGEVGRAVPALASLVALETPLSGQTEFQLADDGTVASGAADVVIGAGYLRSGALGKGGGVLFDEGHVKLSYLAEAHQINLEKLDLLTADGRLVLAGRIDRPAQAAADNNWRYDLNGKLRFTARKTTGEAPVTDIKLAGEFEPASGALRFDRLSVSMPDGVIAGRGHIAPDGGISLSGQIGEMPKSGVLQAWPEFLAVEAREWLVSNVTADSVTGGRFSISMPANALSRIQAGADIPAEAVSVDVTARNVQVTYIDGVPPVAFPDTTVEVRGRVLRLKTGKGSTRMPSGKRLTVSKSDLVVRDLRPDAPEAQVFMQVEGSAAAVAEYLSLKEMGYLKQEAVPKRIQGDASGTLRLRFPMKDDLTDAEIKLIGKIKLANGGATDVFGDMDVAGSALTFDLTEKAIEATGDVLVNGVPGKVRWLRLLDADDDRQPPLRISARLDEADRTQVGLNINHIVRGTIATDITIVPRAGKPPAVSVQADLTQTDIGIDYISWNKPPGKSAIVQFDLVRGDKGLSELQNFKVVGDDIAIDGWIQLGKDNRVRKFALPEFAVDVITRMEVKGELDKDNVWDVQVRASSFDGRPLFRNLFAPKRLSQHLPSKKVRRDGLVIRAFIKTMVGFSDTSLNDVRVVLQRQKGKIIGLEANGALDGGAPVAVRIKPTPGKPRTLQAETKDAGRAFRLIGFYKNIRKGEAKLQVNLDQPGLADISGVLWTRRFYMLGDSVVGEVLSDEGKNGDGAVQGIRTQRDARGKKRTVIEFDQMRVNFSVGNGQFLLQKSFINGPALGATLRGKVDFERRQVQLGGTYVPLYGLNSALGSLPIFGKLFVGRRGEGVLGITFGVQGNLDKPEVLVNPVSLVAPGIFRKIFEITPSKHKITPRSVRRKQRPAGQAPKSSSGKVFRAPPSKNGNAWPSTNGNQN